MSDLPRGNAPAGTAVSTRAQNGGSRPIQGSDPTITDPTRLRTPTDVMRERRAREARRRAEQQDAAIQRQLQEEDIRRRQTEASTIEERNRRAQASRPDSQTAPEFPAAGPANVRHETISAGEQARPRPQNGRQQGGAPDHARISSTTQQNRTAAYEQLNVPATARPAPQQPTANPPPPQQPQSSRPQQSSGTQQARAGFPHAFERWETLSSHWEGLTSYWIRRLQESTNELNGRPTDQQMSRQITDLSAAGANLFHAVVELQRLRASSERKFQRWFFETRNEQEEAAEREAELERQLRIERETKAQSTGSIEVVRAEKAKAEELVREMRRELQISKEEARRAWEELGRREQEERERTIALRSGQPTLIGGVQVVPTQNVSSRHTGSERPHTRDGNYQGGAGPTSLSGHQPVQPQQPPSRSQTTNTSLDSPDAEHRQFFVQPERTSPTSTDPFTETAQSNEPPHLRREPDSQFYSTPPRPSQPATSAAAIAAARAAVASPGRSGQQPATTNGHFYQQPDPQTTIHHPLPATAIGSSQGQQARSRSHTGQSDVPSYVASGQGSSLGEEEYHINPDGSYTRDAHGRRIPYTQPIVEDPNSSDDDHDPEDGSEDYAADIARERMYAQQYGVTPPRQSQDQPITMRAGNTTQSRTTASSGLPSIPQGRVSAPTNDQSTSAHVTSSSRPAQTATGRDEYDDLEYEGEGAGYGAGHPQQTSSPGRWDQPSRLSIIPEEQSVRTSYISGAGGTTRGA